MRLSDADRELLYAKLSRHAAEGRLEVDELVHPQGTKQGSSISGSTQAGRDLTMSKIDYAVKNGMFLDLMFHKITPKQLPAFKQLMTDIAAKYKANIGTW